MKIVLLIILSSALACGCLAAEKRPITPQDLWAMKRLGPPSLSTDGKTAVFSVQEWSIDKNKSTSSLWLTDTSTGRSRRLTTASGTDSSPEWSPDDKRIAFLSRRGEDESTALYLISVEGGEAEKLLELPFAISPPKWMPNNRELVVVTRVIPDRVGSWQASDLAAMKKEEKRRRESKMTAKVTENRHFRYFNQWLTDNLAHRLLKIDVATRAVVDLTPKSDRLFMPEDPKFEIAPDGKSLALVVNSTPPPYREHLNPDIYLVPTDGSGEWKNLTADNRGSDSSPVFSPDGRTLLFSRTKTTIGNGESRKLWRHDLATGKHTEINPELDFSIDDVKFASDGTTLWLVAETEGVVPLFRMNLDGTGLAPVTETGMTSGLCVGPREIIFLTDTLNHPAELFTVDPLSGAVRQLTSFNRAALAPLALGSVENYTFTGAAGDQIHGWLVLPPGYDPKKNYALVQILHGGPHTMSKDSWSYRWNPHVFAAPGYIISCVNRHGSTGFGEKFAMSIVNRWGHAPFEDIMKSTDHLLKRFPNIDPNRVAAAGASYGGYLATWIQGHTDRFKALVTHAGVSNSATMYGADVPHGFAEVMGGTVWENSEGMQRMNPLTYAKDFKTPMLILHGQLDYRVLEGNAFELYGVLQARGVPSRLVVFPNENHWILSPQNSIYWHWEIQSWLSRYIGEKPVLEKPDF